MLEFKGRRQAFFLYYGIRFGGIKNNIDAERTVKLVMILAISIILCWITSALLLTANTLQRHDKAYLLLFFMIVNTNAYNILGDVYKFISITKEPLLFTCFLLYRSVLVPVILTLFINVYYNTGKYTYLIVSVAVLTLTDASFSFVHVITYERWSAFYFAIYIALVQWLGLITLNGFRKWCK